MCVRCCCPSALLLCVRCCCVCAATVYVHALLLLQQDHVRALLLCTYLLLCRTAAAVHLDCVNSRTAIWVYVPSSQSGFCRCFAEFESDKASAVVTSAPLCCHHRHTQTQYFSTCAPSSPFSACAPSSPFLPVHLARCSFPQDASQTSLPHQPCAHSCGFS